ncbi:hypothetical protein [Sorangium sp. So ce1000]|uniref:hypothetical protein n=1 Tax=Sorangium sp. So ce1000 TaxID=3133325 RepID=UPI003F5EBCF3
MAKMVKMAKLTKMAQMVELAAEADPKAAEKTPSDLLRERASCPLAVRSAAR